MYRKHEVEAKLRENHSTLAQAFKTMMYENEVEDLLGLSEVVTVSWNQRWMNISKIVEQMRKYLKVANVYDLQTQASAPIRGCLADGEKPPRRYKDDMVYIDLCGNGQTLYYSGGADRHHIAFELIDGTCIDVTSKDRMQNITDYTKENALTLQVDFNGTRKGPNVIGIDTFIYLITVDGNVHMYGWLYPDGYGEGGIDRYYTGGVCATSGAYGCGHSCGEKIRRNGWRTWARYPWHPKIKK